MRVKISDIPEDGLSVEFSRKAEALESDITASLTLVRTGSDVIIKGLVSSSMRQQCARCLNDFVQDVSARVELSYEGMSVLDNEDQETESDDASRDYKLDDVIDLGHLAEEQILLNVPMRSLCSVDCKGLCPKCGADLNSEPCACDRDDIDPRLQGLKKFLEKKGEKKNG